MNSRNTHQKPKHNLRNDGGKRHEMLDMRRERYFRFDLKDLLETTTNQGNKELIAATIINKASRIGMGEAHEYVDRICGDSLETELADKVKRLLDRYTKYR